MHLTPRTTRRFAVVGLTIAVAVLLSGYAAIFGSIGKHWSGFPIMANGVIGMRVLASPAVFDDLPGLSSAFRLVAISGTPVFSGAEAYAIAAAVPLGTPLDYELESPEGGRRFYTVPTQLFDQGVGYRVWAPVLAIGLIFLATLSVPVFARPDLVATRALFTAALGITLQFCFAVPDIFLAHRIGWWTSLGAWIGLAGVWTLALVFPLPRWPMRQHSKQTIVIIWFGTGLLVGSMAWFGYGAPGRYLVGESILIACLALGVAGVGLNLGLVAWSHPDPALQRQARLVFPGLLIFVVACFVSGIVNTWIGARYAEPLVYYAPALIFSASMGVGILRYDLFGFGNVARRLAGRISMLLAAMSGFFVVFAFFEFALDTALAWAFTVAASGVALCVLAVWPRAFARIEGILETVLLPEKKNARVALEEAAREVARLRDAAGLAQYLEATIAEVLGCAWVRFVIGAPDQTLTEMGGRPDRIRIDVGDPLHSMICAGTSLSTQVGSPAGEGHRDAVLRARVLGVALSVALPVQPGFAGAVLCGVRREGTPYSVADVSLVEMLSSAAGVAFENSRAWDEVQELRGRLERENRFLRAGNNAAPEMGEMVGRSIVLREAVRQIQQVAPTAASVMIIGETGTGKEMAVRMLHRYSDRSDQVLVMMACAAVPEALIESELFGHERGAFTGADERRIGRFEVADGGTLFFDDVDTFPLGIQAKLLRAIQEGEIQRLGSNEVRKVNVRIVSATNRDLLADVHAGRFREDLYYRLNVVPVQLPALRDRRSDIPDLAEYFVRAAAKSLGREDVTEIAAATIEELQAYSWPGNVRELRNSIERAMVMSAGPVLRLPGPLTPASVSRPLTFAASGVAVDDVPVPAPGRIPELGSVSMKELLQRHKRSLIEAALVESGGNQSRAAEMLGVHRSNLNRSIKELGIRVA
jgi:transcriptional regulator with GAF, ATPase, and Fis domain